MSSSSSSFVPGRNRSVVISVAASNFADYIRNSGKSESYDLYRVCRLVCRGWARQLLLDDLSPIGRKIKEDISRDNTHIRGGGPRRTIRGGVVRFLLQKEWQTLPNELWAWRLVRPCDLWWMRIWVPEVRLIWTPCHYECSTLIIDLFTAIIPHPILAISSSMGTHTIISSTI